MSLEAYGWLNPMAKALYGLVKQRRVGNFQAFRKRILIHRIIMVLTCDEGLLRLHLHHRVIGSMVPKSHFENLCATGQG